MDEQETTQTEPGGMSFFRHHPIAMLAIALLLTLVLFLVVYVRDQGLREARETFDAQVENTGLAVDDALREIYSRSGEILEVGEDYLVIRSQAVRDGELMRQSFKVLLTDETTFTERTFSLESTARAETGIRKSALAVGDTVRASTDQNIRDDDVYTATRVERLMNE